MTIEVRSDEKEKSKQRILKSATKLFAQKGFDGVGIREICKDAKANICMISYFWGGKEGLYQGILDDLAEKQIEYAKTFLDLDVDLKTISKKEQVNLLFTLLDNAVESLYGGFISHDLMKFLLQEQQQQRIELTSPMLTYLRKLISAIFDKDINDKEIVFKSVFIMSQINSPLVLPAFSLKLLNQKEFSEQDKRIIKNNVKLYIKTILKEGGINV